MADSVKRLRVFAASPGDTQEERNRLGSVIQEINLGIAADRGLFLELVQWETHVRPGIGSDAQDVINRQIPDADIVIGVFWKRLGTPTGRAASGTAEELEDAIERWEEQGGIEILTYFNQQPYTLRRDDLEQLDRLFAFRERLESLGMLVWSYDGISDFEAKARQHLTAAVRDWPKRPREKCDRPAAPLRSSTTVSSDLIETGVDVHREGDVQSLVSMVRSELLKRGFGAAAAAKTATVLLELLANVREHSLSVEASVRVEVRCTPDMSAVLVVAQQGPSFDLDGAVTKGLWDYQQGDREHGLVKVSRLASYLQLSDTDVPEGWVGMECTVYDLPSMSSGSFDEFDFVAPVYLEFDVPKRWRLGPDVQVGRSLEPLLSFALTKPAPRLLDLLFGGVRVPDDGYLGIEFSGNVLPSEVSPLWLEAEVSPDLPQPRSKHVLNAAMEVQFNLLFQSKKVVMHAYDTGFIPTEELQVWAARWDLPFFTDREELRTFLARIGR